MLKSLNFAFLFVFMFLSISSYSQPAPTNQKVSENIETVNRLYNINENTAIFSDEVDGHLTGKTHLQLVELSNHIIKYRQLYTSDTIAKIYALLADDAKKHADLAKAFQFASDGLSLQSLSPEIELRLLQSLSNGYYSSGKYYRTIETADRSISIATSRTQLKYLLIAFGHRAMAHALTAEYEKANEDLEKIASLIKDNHKFSDHIELLEIIAMAHYYLSDYQTSANTHNKIIQIKLEKNLRHSLAQSYFNLAQSYEGQGKLDDAFNAYWEAHESVKYEKTPIRDGFIQLGFGNLFLVQGKYEQAFEKLTDAEELLAGKNLIKPYLTTLILLAKAALNTERAQHAFELLSMAEQISTGVELTERQIELYWLLYKYHQQQANINNALFYLEKYVLEYQKFSPNSKQFIAQSNSQKDTAEQSINLANSLAREAEGIINERETVSHQQLLTLLILSVLVLALLLVVLWLRRKTIILNKAYNDHEKPTHFMHNSTQIKQLYQLNYKQSRKFEYPLAVAFLVFPNWAEITTRVNKKVADEIRKTIAILINESLSEFDYAGTLSEEQFLILCPHQSNDEIQQRLQSLNEALRASFFANLGDFIILLDYAYDTPSMQDIDPYIFLSKLSDKVNAKYAN